MTDAYERGRLVKHLEFAGSAIIDALEWLEKGDAEAAKVRLIAAKFFVENRLTEIAKEDAARLAKIVTPFRRRSP